MSGEYWFNVRINRQGKYLYDRADTKQGADFIAQIFGRPAYRIHVKLKTREG